MNMSLFSGTFVRPSETVIEAYWTGTAFKTILVTPNVQVFLQPAFPPLEEVAAAFIVRVAQLF